MSDVRETDRQRVAQVLALVLCPGVGPVLCQRLIEFFGSPEAAQRVSSSTLQRVKGIGHAKARAIADGLRESGERAQRELDLADSLGVRIIARGESDYPPLLDQIPSAPAVIYVRGMLEANGADRFAVAMVGSRRCSSYGIEQSERFAGVLAGAGLTIVSGGARGIDAAAHRGALKAGGRTAAVLGCGLARVYPPEHESLFASIAAEGNGAVISELPLETEPTAENFPSRNRIISGLSLGVLVVEAGARSGALITARQAVEDHGREVMALPGRVDMVSCRGSLALLKSGSAAMVTEPGDVIELLDSPAHHHHGGTFAARYRGGADAALPQVDDTGEVNDAAHGPGLERPESVLAEAGSPEAAVLACLDRPRTLDEVSLACGLDAASVRSALTILEIQGRVRRAGSRIEARIQR